MTLKLFSKWIVLIWINTIFSFIFALMQNIDGVEEIAGMICGVFSFVVLYSFIDFRLLQRGKELLRKWILIGTLILAISQFYPVLQFLIGILAVSSFDDSLRPNLNFLEAYIVTLLAGLLLSIVLIMIVFLIGVTITKIVPFYKKQRNLKRCEF